DGVVECGGDVVAGEDLFRRTGGGDPPVGEQQCMGRGGGELFHVVGHKDRCQVRVGGGEQVDGVEKLLSGGDIEPRGGFVEQEQPWIGGKIGRASCRERE